VNGRDGVANSFIPGKNHIDLYAGIPKYVEVTNLNEKKPPGKINFSWVSPKSHFMVYWSYTEKKPSPLKNYDRKIVRPGQPFHIPIDSHIVGREE
jgi:hypothetical protein